MIGKELRITVVTVSYNSGRTIEKTIKSVISQGYSNLEYIIIDGGSTDGTVDIIKRYEKNISYWISEPDKGIYNAMNKGARFATGDVIAFLNSDDWYADNALEVIAKKFKSTNADVVYGGITFVGKEGNKKIVFGDVELEDFCYGFEMAHPSTFILLDVFKKYYFDEKYRIAADYKLCAQLCNEGYHFECVKENVAFFSEGGASGNIEQTAIETREVAYEIFGRFGRHAKMIKANCIMNLMGLILERIEIDKGDWHKYSKKTYVFGTGRFGIACLKCLQVAKVKVLGLVDNDVRKKRMKINGICVMAPEELKEENDALVIISSLKYGEEMEEQIKGMDLGESIRVIRCEEFAEDVYNIMQEQGLSLESTDVWG